MKRFLFWCDVISVLSLPILFYSVSRTENNMILKTLFFFSLGWVFALLVKLIAPKLAKAIVNSGRNNT